MIWTVVLWLGMQGQRANEPNSRILMEPNVICQEWLPDSRSSCDAAPTQFKYFKPTEHVHGNGNLVCDHYFPEDNVTCYADPAPVEYVFEIRTKREDHGKAYDAQTHEWTTNCKDDDLVQFTPEEREAHCVRITRELWMDGKRLGIIKGLD